MKIFFNIAPLLLSIFFLTQASAEPVIDFLTVRDLELVDSVNQSHSGVAEKLDRTQTKIGSALLRDFLVNPTTDLELITKRQDAIKALVADPVLRGKVRSVLGHFAKREQALTFFDKDNAPAALTSVVESFQYSLPFLTSWNRSVFALDARHVLQSFSPLITAIFEFAVLHFALEYLTGGHDDHHGHNHAPGHICIHHAHAPQDASWIIKTLVGLAKAGHIALHLVSIKDMVEFVSAKMAVMNQLFQELKSLHVIVTDAQYLHTITTSNAALSDLLPIDACAQLHSLFSNNYFQDDLDEQNELDISSLVGNTLVTYGEVQKHTDAIDQIKSGIALLDVYHSAAELILATQPGTPGFCYTEFITNKEPCMAVTNGWHPMLSPTDVICNSFHTAGKKYILSGPNRSGKSSFLRMLGLNAVFSQSLGIAAADECRMTLVHKILSFMTIADDIATGQSSYVARMIRADACLQAQKTLQPGQHALVLLDDSVGQGTSTQRGEEVARAFVAEMGAFKNILFAASHFDAVKELGKIPGSGFENIRMGLVTNADGNPKAAYVLEPGVSDTQDVSVLVNGLIA